MKQVEFIKARYKESRYTRRASESRDIYNCQDHRGIFEGYFESTGNYAYHISKREIEKVALALNYQYVAFKGLNDSYFSGLRIRISIILYLFYL